MEEVKIAELKARLSHYVRLAEAGEEIIVKDRERPVARLVGCNPSTSPDFGVPRRVSREQAAKILAAIQRPKLSHKAIDEALRWVKRDRLPGRASPKRKS